MTTVTQKLETARRIQVAMATAYSSMGAWCLFHPSSVISLSLTPQFAIAHRTTYLLMRCFGAQAMTSGLLLGVSDMTSTSFTAFGLAMLPYLGFNAWFIVGPGRGVFTNWLWLDLVGNVVFLTGSMVAAKLLTEAEQEKAKKL